MKVPDVFRRRAQVNVRTGLGGLVACFGNPDPVVACFGNPAPGGMAVHDPLTEEALDGNETTEEGSSGRDRGDVS